MKKDVIRTFYEHKDEDVLTNNREYFEELMKLFNIALTNTYKQEIFKEKRFNIRNDEINKNNCISLYDLVNKFNILHNKFVEEYEKIGKLNFGELASYDFISYDNVDGARCIKIGINKKE